MTTLLCAAFWLLTPLFVLLAVLAWFTETRPERIQRLRCQGLSQARIATQLGISRHQVRRALA